MATPTTNSAWPGADFYELSAQQFTQQMHPDLPNPTHLWGYVDMATNKTGYLGPLIIAQRGKPTVIRMHNNLPDNHILPVDTTLMGSEEGVPVNRCCVHLHGGFVPWTADGGPWCMVHALRRSRRDRRLGRREFHQWRSGHRRAPPTTTIPITRASGWCGITTTPWASPA